MIWTSYPRERLLHFRFPLLVPVYNFSVVHSHERDAVAREEAVHGEHKRSASQQSALGSGVREGLLMAGLSASRYSGEEA